MKKLLILFMVLLTASLFANGPISFKVYDGKLKAEIELAEDEHIAFIEEFLFLNVESEHYDFIFSGYPEPDVTKDGFSYYSGSLSLEGDLILKDGILKSDYEIEVTLGYQTCTDEGVCYIPVEVTRSILVKQSNRFFYLFVAGGILLIMLLFTLRKRKNG